MTDLLTLTIGDDPAAWRALGFAVAGDGTCRIGLVAVVLDGAGEGLREWTLRGEEGPAEVDGLATRWSAVAPSSPGVGEHPNGAIAIDHVVVFTEERERTTGALERAGGSVRRRADTPAVPMPMAFVRLGSAIVEVAQTGRPEHTPAAFWGLVVVVGDLDAAVAAADGRIGDPQPALQPGRRIATVRPAAGLEVPLALISPR